MLRYFVKLALPIRGGVHTGRSGNSKRLLSSLNSSTVSSNEARKFARSINEWWDKEGPFKLLHDITPLRVNYIKNSISAFLNAPKREDIKILDVGCGGGLLAEPLARLGYSVTGIDISRENIDVSKAHSQEDPALCSKRLEFIETSAEDLLKTRKNYYDVVCSLEVIEHVNNPDIFLQALADHVKPGGIMIISTPNRNVPSYIALIAIAENLFNWIDKGTHDYDKFIQPSELIRMLDQVNFKTIDLQSILYNPILMEWSLSHPATSMMPMVNYILVSRGQMP